MSNLTDVAESNTLKWLLGQATTAPTTPLESRLMTANGTDAAAGTEAANAGGSAYAPLDVTWAAESGGASNNSATLSYVNMPAVTVVGLELWDAAATPLRWWHGALTAPKTLNLGDTFEIPAGDLDLSMG